MSKDLSVTSNIEIVNEIIKIGEKCLTHGAENVFISGLLQCSRVDPSRIKEINELFSIKCEQMEFMSDFTFIDNDNITEQHLWKDGIHLKENGKNILANNYLYYLYNFLHQAMYTPR